MKKLIHIGIADDHLIVLDGLVAIFDAHENIKVVYTAVNGNDLLQKNRASTIDVLLLDLDMPILSGKEAFYILKNEAPDLKIIILSSLYNEENIVAYYKKGANAFLSKDCKSEKLLEAINEVYIKGKYYDQDVADMLLKAAYTKPPKQVLFSDREIEIIKLICKDKSSKEIAEALSVNIRTVEYDRSAILTKIDARSSAAIVLYAVKHKIIEV